MMDRILFHSTLLFAVRCILCSDGFIFQPFFHYRYKEVKLIHNHVDVINKVTKSACQAWITRRVYAANEARGRIDVTENDDMNFQQTMQRSVTLDKYDTSQQLTLLVGSSALHLVLQSPLWKYVLVPLARKKIIDTAQANGIPWSQCMNWLLSQRGPWNNSTETHKLELQQELDNIPTWYRNAAYHAYETGHLSWNAAIELELASAAIGARNIPNAGANGETMFRSAFREALIEAGAIRVPLPLQNGTSLFSHIVDIGCGTGTSTRFLGQMFPQWDKVQITGIDLSPYFIQTGIRLHELLLSNNTSQSMHNIDTDNSGPWVCSIQSDRRIRYLHGDGTNLSNYFNDNTADIVNAQFVFHELPVQVACDIIKEAHRILRTDGGQLWISEMDFESPAYKAQRNNPFLFSLVRATEPFLDEYASGQSLIWKYLYETFDAVTITAATGRHYAVVATKDDTTNMSRWNDLRFNENGHYRIDDTHLQLWENKSRETIENQQ